MEKKQDIIKHATRLFAEQGFDGTTTLQIANQAGVTEPLIYYHFKGKEDLFTSILSATFDEYFKRLAALKTETRDHFDKIAELIELHFQFLKDFPDETYLIVSACPSRLRESAHICAKLLEKQRANLTRYISECLQVGIAQGQFSPVPVVATTTIIITIINGLMRRSSLKLVDGEGLQSQTLEFCRRSLMVRDDL
jgi:AcrR family transcriptional regulator